MATITRIMAVYDDQFTGYKQGSDWTDDGDGTLTPVPGGALETALAAGRTAYAQRSAYSDVAPTGPFNWKLDGTNSGLRKIATPSTAYASGTDVVIDQQSLHVSEANSIMQTRIRWQCWADEATAQALDVGDYFTLRLAITGSAAASDEWRGVITQRNPIVDGAGLRRYDYIGTDLGTLIRAADTSNVPRLAQAAVVTLPADAEAPPQTLLGGVQAYMLSDLLADVVPATLTFELNAPDVIIERLPDRADALTMLQGVLKSSGYYMRWDCADKALLVIEQHEHTSQSVGLVLTDSQVFEVSRQVGYSRKSPGQIERVIIERPQDYGDPDAQALPPDRSKAPQGSMPMGILRPTASDASASDAVVYSVSETWEPQQTYTTYQPGPIMYAFSDPAYLASGYTGDQLYQLLKRQSDSISISPPVRYTERKVQGYYGLDYYFCINPVYTSIRQANTYIDGYVVSRSGYFNDSGAVNRLQQPIANARVTLVGENTGVVYEVVTDGNGYYRVDDAVPDDYSPSVYLDDDSYLANKHDAYTDPHPYDDDPYNDDLGPDNSVQRPDEYEIAETRVAFSVTYATGLLDRSGTNDDYNTFSSYRGYGAFDYGDSTKQAYVLDDLEGVALGIDTANVTSELQANQLAEQIIDESADEGNVWVVTKPFGGRLTHSGAVVRIATSSDVAVNQDMRINAREIHITPDGLPKETLSSSVDYFMAETDRQYSRIDRTETLMRETQNRVRDLYRRIQEGTGKLAAADQLGQPV